MSSSVCCRSCVVDFALSKSESGCSDPSWLPGQWATVAGRQDTDEAANHRTLNTLSHEGDRITASPHSHRSRLTKAQRPSLDLGLEHLAGESVSPCSGLGGPDWAPAVDSRIAANATKATASMMPNATTAACEPMNIATRTMALIAQLKTRMGTNHWVPGNRCPASFSFSCASKRK